MLDQGEQCADYRVSRQPSPAPVRGEAGQAGEVLHQGEGPESPGPQQNLGCPGRQARDYREEYSRPLGKAGMGFLSRATRPLVRLFSGVDTRLYMYVCSTHVHVHLHRALVPVLLRLLFCRTIFLCTQRRRPGTVTMCTLTSMHVHVCMYAEAMGSNVAELFSCFL